MFETLLWIRITWNEMRDKYSNDFCDTFFLLLRPNKTVAFILLNTQKRVKIFQFGEKYVKDPCTKNFPTLKFYYVILKIGVNGRFAKVISTTNTIIASPEPRVLFGRGHVHLSMLHE